MSRCTAVICELNPLHTGHAHVFRRAAQYGAPVLAVMSGNFTQRSECAVFDKYKRAELAVRAGADIVVELPFPWYSSGGEFFALGGVSVGVSLGADCFVFGSESGDTEFVKKAAACMTSAGFKSRLAHENTADSGTAAAHDRAMKHFGFSLGANDKLASQYINAAEKLGADAEFTAVKRISDREVYRSATELREMIYDGNIAEAKRFMPHCRDDISISDVCHDRLSELEYIFFRLFYHKGDGERILDGGGGVADRLAWAAGESASYADFFETAATKKYTDSRMRRAALFTMLGVSREDAVTSPEFTFLLGASRRGREYLSSFGESADFSLLTKPSTVYRLTTDTAKRQYKLSVSADEVYALCMTRGVKSGEFLRRKPYIE